jgi:hypothetical protein
MLTNLFETLLRLNLRLFNIIYKKESLNNSTMIQNSYIKAIKLMLFTSKFVSLAITA